MRNVLSPSSMPSPSIKSRAVFIWVKTCIARKEMPGKSLWFLVLVSLALLGLSHNSVGLLFQSQSLLCLGHVLSIRWLCGNSKISAWYFSGKEQKALSIMMEGPTSRACYIVGQNAPEGCTPHFLSSYML